MSTDMTDATASATAYQQALKDIENLMKAGPDDKHSRFWVALHFLQVFSVWGLGLPTDSFTLRPTLKVPDGTKVSFEETLLAGNQSVKSTCKDFQERTLPKMIAVASGLLNHGDMMAKDKADLFGTVRTMAASDPKSALALLRVLINSAAKCRDDVKEVESALGAFYAGMESASKYFTSAQGLIDTDELTSQKTLDKLRGGLDVEDSLSSIQQKLSQDQEEYQQAVTVAATTPIYAWITVPIPIGPVAAIIVAAKFGNDALRLADEMEQLQAKFQAATSELQMALTTRMVAEAGQKTVEQSLDRIAAAKEHVTTVKNAWVTMHTALEGLEGLLAASVSSGKLLPNFDFIVDMMQAKWIDIYPLVKDILAEPYINVLPGTFDMNGLAGQIRTAAAPTI